MGKSAKTHQIENHLHNLWIKDKDELLELLGFLKHDNSHHDLKKMQRLTIKIQKYLQQHQYLNDK